MTGKRRPVTIDELNDALAGRIAREAELARIRAAAEALRVAASPPSRQPGGTARPRRLVPTNRGFNRPGPPA